MKLVRLLTLLPILIFLSSCLDSAQFSDEKRVSLLFNVQNVGTALEIEENVVTITEFKFTIDRFTLSSEDGFSVGTQDRITALIFSYDEDIENSNLVIDVGLGFSDNIVFFNYQMFLEPPVSRTGVFDDDFFSDNENYSIVMIGEINGSEFMYRSTGKFEKTFNFEPARLSDTNETLVIRKSFNIADLLTDEEGNFIDPTVESNDQVLVNKLNMLLEVTASAEDIF